MLELLIKKNKKNIILCKKELKAEVFAKNILN